MQGGKIEGGGVAVALPAARAPAGRDGQPDQGYEADGDAYQGEGYEPEPSTQPAYPKRRKRPVETYADNPVAGDYAYSGDGTTDAYPARKLPRSTSPTTGGTSFEYDAAPDGYAPPEKVYRQGTQSNDQGFSIDEINGAGHRFFGKITGGLASVIEYAFQRSGRPNGYILGEEGGGAFIAGLRYGEGTLYTRDAGTHRVYWQGPSIGYDFGAEGSKTMILVYNLRSPQDMYRTFGGVDGSAYLVGGVGITYLQSDHIVLAPIRSGLGLRLGANVGYLKYTQRPTWNPF